MAAVTSTMLPLGTKAPDFRLPSATGGTFSLKDFSQAKGLVIMFICNHCPYVKHVRKGLIDVARDYERQGISFVAINANDWTAYPDDTPEQMAREAREYAYPFPYLYDDSQDSARAYQAACTPDIFLFDEQRRLVYRGQLDDSRPGNGVPVTAQDLRAAMDALLQGEKISANQKPSLGCNIKWRQGREPEYFRKAAN